MEGNKSHPRAILVFGAPCSGKTTFSEQFSKRFHAPFYNLAEIAADNNFSDQQLYSVLELIARSQTTVILEGLLDTEADRDKVRRIFRAAGYEPRLIWIQTDVSTLRSRLKSRLKSVAKAKAEYDERIATLEAPSELEFPIVLSGKHTYATQQRHVLTQLAQKRPS